MSGVENLVVDEEWKHGSPGAAEMYVPSRESRPPSRYRH